MRILSDASFKTTSEPRISSHLRVSTPLELAPYPQRLWLTQRSLSLIGAPRRRTSRRRSTRSLIKKFSTHPRDSWPRLRRAMHSSSLRTLWLAVACSSLGSKGLHNQACLQHRTIMTMYHCTEGANSRGRTLVRRS